LGNPRVLAAVCVAALLAGTVGALVLTQRLRQEGPIVTDIRLKTPEPGRYRVCFQTPRDDRFEVAIVDSNDEAVRVLAADVSLEGDSTPDKQSAHCFDWDGTGEGGTIVGPGEYRLRVFLRGADRTGISGERLTITAPVS
jgi:hypothetical protein